MLRYPFSACKRIRNEEQEEVPNSPIKRRRLENYFASLPMSVTSSFSTAIKWGQNFISMLSNPDAWTARNKKGSEGDSNVTTSQTSQSEKEKDEGRYGSNQSRRVQENDKISRVSSPSDNMMYSPSDNMMPSPSDNVMYSPLDSRSKSSVCEDDIESLSDRLQKTLQIDKGKPSLLERKKKEEDEYLEKFYITQLAGPPKVSIHPEEVSVDESSKEEYISTDSEDRELKQEVQDPDYLHARLEADISDKVLKEKFTRVQLSSFSERKREALAPLREATERDNNRY